ncbi:peptide-methionine (S)-S-oxide reductase [Algoriphagus sp. Y33]|uniref:peptide-methionine (S)-S-oxide reductase n=1 Tax=Algoriphagus sp. Y33 TaxID=2772483 RepID=UPI00177D26C4|nr:peptide-methionine (S)-S-oxide reductase [Algoriphagus sp. Y33]
MHLPKVFDDRIVTEVSALIKFYRLEEYHRDYYNQNGAQLYRRNRFLKYISPPLGLT